MAAKKKQTAATEPKPKAVRAPRGEGKPRRRRAATADAEGEEEEASADAAEPEADEDEEREEKDESDETAIEAESESEVIEADSVKDIMPRSSPGASSALARVDSLQVYMREVQRYPLLSPDEEHELAVHYTKSGDVPTAHKLVTANLRLVVKIAYEYRRAYRNMMDLIQEGNYGLMQAVKRYDPYRGVKLSSYAAWWIRAYMLRYILNNWRLVKLGTTQAQRKLFFNLNKEKARLSAMGIEPTSDEIARRLNVDEKDVIEMDRRLARGDASLDAQIGDAEGKTTTRMDLLPASGAGPDSIAEGAELQELVRERLDEFRNTLAGKDLVIFDKRLVAEDPLTLQELGDEFGVSRERVRQLEARMTGKLREYLERTLGDAVAVG